MPRLSLPLAGQEQPDPPLYTGDIEADIRWMNKRQSEEIGGKLSHPSKMDVVSWGIPATRCRVGAALAQVEGSTCSVCYALKGTFRFSNVQAVLEANYRKLFNEKWTPAMAAQFRWIGEERVRLFMSGDLQGMNHLLNIIQIANAVRQTIFWMPTRELKLLRDCPVPIPENLIPRASAAMIDGPAPRGFRNTSTVVSTADENTCPSSVQGGCCADHDCTRCWTDDGDIPYLKH